MTRCNHYCVIKFVNELLQGRWFSQVSSNNKTERHDITEILLKVALNTITLTLKFHMGNLNIIKASPKKNKVQHQIVGASLLSLYYSVVIPRCFHTGSCSNLTFYSSKSNLN